MSLRRIVSRNDILQFGKLLAGSAVGSLLPERFDDAAAERLMRIHPAAHADRLEELAALMEKSLPAMRNGDWKAMAREHGRMTVEEAWGRFRGIGLRGWHPQIEFAGEQHVRRALESGLGAVIWCMRFSSDVVLKQGFHRIGLPLVHLSDAVHGAQSTTPIARRLLSPLFRRAEDPYLRERVVIPIGGGLGYWQTLRDHLHANHCVSIFGDSTGRQTVEAPFLTGRGKFATGAPSLAWAEKCPLLPAHVIRSGRFRYRVVVGEPIGAERARSRKEFASEAVLEFAQRMERIVEDHPADWQDWILWKEMQK